MHASTVTGPRINSHLHSLVHGRKFSPARSQEFSAQVFLAEGNYIMADTRTDSVIFTLSVSLPSVLTGAYDYKPPLNQ